MTIAPRTFRECFWSARRSPLLVAMLALVVAGSACAGSGGKSDLEVAQVAVRANPALELVATDAQQGVLTVRVKATGQLLTVKASEVNAGTAFTNVSLEASTTAAPAPAAPAEGAAPAAAPSSSPAQGTSSGVAVSATRDVDTRGGTVERVKKETSVNTAGGVRVDASSTTTERGRTSSARVTTPGGLVIDVPQAGQATVTTGGRPATPAAKPAAAPPATPATAPGAGPVADLSPMFDESRLKRRSAPASCRSGQDASLIGVLLEVDGVAVTVGGGCNMRIRGSLIVGGDTTIVVEDGGNLYVEGSDIQSRGVSVRLDKGSNGYLGKSVFRGRVATQAGANMFDQGGNTWK